MGKSEYWIHALEDCLTLIAKLPALAARIYRNVYKPDAKIPVLDKNLDLVGGCNVGYTSLTLVLTGLASQVITQSFWVMVTITA